MRVRHEDRTPPFLGLHSGTDLRGAGVSNLVEDATAQCEGVEELPPSPPFLAEAESSEFAAETAKLLSSSRSLTLLYRQSKGIWE